MKYIFYIIIFLFSLRLTSQSDSAKQRLNAGCSVGVVNFLDYGIIRERVFDKNGYYQGFDLGLFLRSDKKHLQLSLGVLGGDKYPVLNNLNYYLGLSYFLKTKNHKYLFEVSSKWMCSYSVESSFIGRSIIRREASFQVGVGGYRKFKRWEIGLSYFVWASDYRIATKQTNFSGEADVVENYRRRGWLPIGVLQIKAGFLLN